MYEVHKHDNDDDDNDDDDNNSNNMCDGSITKSPGKADTSQ